MKHAFLVFFLFLLLLFFQVSNPKITKAAWTKYPASPVLTVGSLGSWDSKTVGSPSVIYHNSKFNMWYEGTDGLNMRIGYASSIDGISWQKYPYFVIDILDNTNNNNVHDPKVIIINNVFHMWYAASLPSVDNIHINHTTSSDGINWNNPDINILFSSLSWEGYKGISFPYTIIINGQYNMWYAAHGTYNGSTKWRFGYAYSSDGIHWTKHPVPIMEATQPWEGWDIGNPTVLYEDGIYHMWYHASGGIGHATSSDGIKWDKDKDNPVLKPGPSSWDDRRILNPYVLKKDGIDYMWYTGEGDNGPWQIGLATSVPITPIPTNITPILTSTPTPTVTPIPTATNIPIPSSTPAVIPSLTPIPTTTTPVDTSSYPIVILPGLGASWNPRAMFSCNLDSFGRWTMAPYVSVYQRLINTLTKNAKLRLNRDVYIYAYDWRQPLDRQAEDFKNYLDGILAGKPDSTKVKLIGHSLGGLVIRSYLANNPNDHRVAQALTVGTPHQGSVLAYPAWEKGEVWTDNNLSRMALSQLISYCKFVRPDLSSRQTRVSFRIRNPREIIQLIAPSIKDLLPTFNFLRKNGTLINTNKLTYQNDWIASHPIPDNLYQISLSTLSGNNFDTLRYLDVVDPTSEELHSGDWIDGKPIGSKTSKDGDGTVLSLSSQISGAYNQIIDGNHGDIIYSEDAIKKILSFLDLDKVKPAQEIPLPEETSKNILTVSVDREAKMEMSRLGSNSLTSEERIIVNYNPQIGRYTLIITPKETSLAFLYITQITNKKSPETITKDLALEKNKPVRFIIMYNPLRPLQLIQN